ncbi:MAG TPA: PDZ domain-containing protein [Tepidisphaeraceae bacterium]|nr:PDZ domain-containing protein [Tepidisphaeraceae bacterium]
MAIAICGGLLARARENGPATQPLPTPARPLLDALNRETQGLFQEVRASVVRVQLPQPRWMNAYARAPLNHWEQLDPGMRKRLEPSLLSGTTVIVRTQRAGPAIASATTRPADALDEPRIKIEGHGTIIFVPTQVQPPPAVPAPLDPILGGRLHMDVNAVVDFEPNNVGLVIDEAGHVLVPLYIEREAVGEAPVKVGLGDGQVVNARFIGSDRQTNLTLLLAAKVIGKPVTLAAQKPADGSLVLFLSPLDGSGRLGLWNGGQQEYGFVFGTDGRAAGIARFGQFLSGSACRLIAEQLIRYGAVKRATLGVLISEIRKDDPLRGQLPVLGTRTAVRVDEVIAGSAADKAGLKAGDLLLALAGQAVSDIPSFAAAIAARSGETQLQVLRGSNVLKVTVDLRQQK